MTNHLSPTQRLMLDILVDGKPHHPSELHACLDSYGDESNIHRHLSALRKILRPQGQDIICQFIRRQRLWRLIRCVEPDSTLSVPSPAPSVTDR